MWYNVNWQRFVLWMLPIYLRKPKLFSFINALIAPIETLHNAWLVFRQNNIYRLNHNGQTVYFRKALNDVFDNNLRRIQIINANAIKPNYVYTPQENKAYFLNKPTYIRSSNESVNNGVDFTVQVPKQIIDNQLPRLKFEINYYRQAGKRFNIEQL